jgi:hypothetical protein
MGSSAGGGSLKPAAAAAAAPPYTSWLHACTTGYDCDRLLDIQAVSLKLAPALHQQTLQLII